jgi:hypothetical protein
MARLVMSEGRASDETQVQGRHIWMVRAIFDSGHRKWFWDAGTQPPGIAMSARSQQQPGGKTAEQALTAAGEYLLQWERDHPGT